MARSLEGSEPIPGYRLIERLGRGGFGEVWKAEAPGGLLKAIKFVYGEVGGGKDLHSEPAAAEQELKALSRVKSVRHPYILSLERYDIIDGQLMIVMELADQNLMDRFHTCCKQGLPGIARAELLRYMDEAAEALDMMNAEYQLQHLDVKPQNLFLVHNHVKVADFGLVKDLEGMKAAITGGVTPLYAAPETFEGWVSRYCDQYSLAIVYQELLTGRRPFSGTNARQLILQHVQAVPDLSSLPAADQPAIGRSLAKKPEERFPTCAELVQALRSGKTDGPAVAVSVPAAPPAATAAKPDENTVPVPRRVAPPRPLSPAPIPTRPPAVPVREISGDGALFPALVIGLGETALRVLQELRQALQLALDADSRKLNALTNLRFLYLDTDPEGVKKAGEGKSVEALSGDQVLLTRLNRASHYVKPHDIANPLDAWIDPKLIYRIPRNPATVGIRALGRLAFHDNYPQIVERLSAELRSLTQADLLRNAAETTQLGIRSNLLRVYVVAGLAGGTGGGMFIDLAYAVRRLLSELGYQPDVVGLFLLPARDAKTANTLALGNTFAALTELNHFRSPGVGFTAQYDPKAAPVADAAPPFGRCVFLPLPLEGEEAAGARAAPLAGGWLLRELTTPIGRQTKMRRGHPTGGKTAPGSGAWTSFGIYRFTWPRCSVGLRAGYRICRRLVERWMARDSAPMRAEIQHWIIEQWHKRQLGPEGLLQRLAAASESTLGQGADSAFATVTASLSPQNPKKRELDANTAFAVLDQVEKLVGRPDDELRGVRCALVGPLDEASRAQKAEGEQRLAEMSVKLIEQPRFRLAGAEEAIRQLTLILEQVAQEQEIGCQKALVQAVEVYLRLQGLINTLGAGKRTSTPELVELLRLYPRLRFQHLVLQRVVFFYKGLLESCPEYLRELAFCRTRLEQFHRGLGSAAATDRPEPDSAPGKALLPAGCKNFDQAADEFVKRLTPDEYLEIDQRVQAAITKEFKALVHICMSSTNLFGGLEKVMLEQVQPFAAQRLSRWSVTEVFQERHPDPAEAIQTLRAASEAAGPKLADAPSSLDLIVVPEDSSLEFRKLVEEALPRAQVLTVPKSDEILFYRELSDLSPADLPQLGAQAAEAYRQLASAEHFTPHSRTDIDWLPLERG